MPGALPGSRNVGEIDFMLEANPLKCRIDLRLNFRGRTAQLLVRWILLALVAVISVAPSTSSSAEATPRPASAGRVPGQSKQFAHLTLENGLSDQRVQTLLQDRDGFIWIGTNN